MSNNSNSQGNGSNQTPPPSGELPWWMTGSWGYHIPDYRTKNMDLQGNVDDKHQCRMDSQLDGPNGEKILYNSNSSHFDG